MLGVSQALALRSRQRKPEHETTTDFQSLMAEDNRRVAIRIVNNRHPELRRTS